MQKSEEPGTLYAIHIQV